MCLGSFNSNQTSTTKPTRDVSTVHPTNKNVLADVGRLFEEESKGTGEAGALRGFSNSINRIPQTVREHALTPQPDLVLIEMPVETTPHAPGLRPVDILSGKHGHHAFRPLHVLLVF